MGETVKIDITNAACPETSVRVKTALEAMADGGILEIRLNSGEPMGSVPGSLKNEGHRVIHAEQEEGGGWVLRVLKGGLAPG
ncbi:MAG: sulfurtransferase TusA family protein [Treponema sp.]|jgi:tRNA 2-thiouridine synthesizing protein A|nr:sulfurtransferase TusA family protein [Treponema sp.]